MVTINGNPWFAASDVLRVLGCNTNQNGIRFYLKQLDASEITPTKLGIERGAKTLLISESGLYKLILGSRKPNAKPLKDWVSKVVLPAIRKDGGYIMGEEKVVTAEMSASQSLLSEVSNEQASDHHRHHRNQAGR